MPKKNRQGRSRRPTPQSGASATPAPREAARVSSGTDTGETSDGAAIGFVLFDPNAPYLVREPYPFFQNDTGPWLDLEVSQVDRTGRQRVSIGDGPYRELLWRCRVGKEHWVAASQPDRRLIKGSLDGLLGVEIAVRDLLDPRSDERTRERSRAYLQRAAKLWTSSQRERRGLARHVGRRFGAPVGRARLVELRHVLRDARAEMRASSTDLLGDLEWLNQRCRQVNWILTESKRIPLPGVCTLDDLRALADHSPAAIAEGIVLRAMPAVSVDDLRRKKPHSRRKKPRSP
jgi:hypothetical protein